MRPSYSTCTIRILHDLSYRFSNINFLLTERKCPTEEFWLDLLTVQTEHSEVFTVRKEGQYSQVRLEQAWVAHFVSGLFHGTQTKLVYFKFFGFCDLKDIWKRKLSGKRANIPKYDSSKRGWRISLVVYFMALRPNLFILNFLAFAT